MLFNTHTLCHLAIDRQHHLSHARPIDGRVHHIDHRNAEHERIGRRRRRR
jgi:hypothetical protein